MKYEPYIGLQGAVAQYAVDQTRNTRANPFSFLISAPVCVILRALHNTQDQLLYALTKEMINKKFNSGIPGFITRNIIIVTIFDMYM